MQILKDRFHIKILISSFCLSNNNINKGSATRGLHSNKATLGCRWPAAAFSIEARAPQFASPHHSHLHWTWSLSLYTVSWGRLSLKSLGHNLSSLSTSALLCTWDIITSPNLLCIKCLPPIKLKTTSIVEKSKKGHTPLKVWLLFKTP